MLLLSCSAFGQEAVQYITLDSLKQEVSLSANWRFTLGDDSAYSSPSFNDSGWQVRSSLLLLSGKDKLKFDSIGWFRKRIYIDSSIGSRSIVLIIQQYGASEVFVDGRGLMQYGNVGDRNTSTYFDPALPLSVKLFPGEHLIAIRYANFRAAYNFERYDEDMAGFNMHIAEANHFIEEYYNNRITSITLLVFLFAFFLGFSILHLSVFLYNRHERANFYFSLFCLALAGVMFAIYLKVVMPYPGPSLAMKHVLVTTCCIMSVCLSGFLNTLFGKMKRRFLLIVLLGVLSLVVWIVFHVADLAWLAVLVACVEALFLIVRAIFREVKGAFIVGFGILVFSCCILISISRALYYDSDLNMGGAMTSVLLLAVLSVPVSMSIYLSKNYASVNKNLGMQLKNVETLSAKALEQELEKQRLLESRGEELEREVAVRTAELVAQKQKSDDLLRNILPEEVAEELKETGSTVARHFDHVSVLFTDFVDFTRAGERMSPQELVDELHTCFKAFDDIISRYNIEKIKTIGDAYLAVSGLPVADAAHAHNVTRAALEIRQFMEHRRVQFPERAFHIRIGIHSGSVVAGIVGVKKFAYDIWGDTVNTAARMEQSGAPGEVNISEATYQLVKDAFLCTARGEIAAKGKGSLDMYFVKGEK